MFWRRCFPHPSRGAPCSSSSSSSSESVSDESSSSSSFSLKPCWGVSCKVFFFSWERAEQARENQARKLEWTYVVFSPDSNPSLPPGATSERRQHSPKGLDTVCSCWLPCPRFLQPHSSSLLEVQASILSNIYLSDLLLRRPSDLCINYPVDSTLKLGNFWRKAALNCYFGRKWGKVKCEDKL